MIDACVLQRVRRLKHDTACRVRQLVRATTLFVHPMHTVARLDHFEANFTSRTDGDLVIATVPCSTRAKLLRARVPAHHDRELETNHRAFEDPHESPTDPERGDVCDAEQHKVPNGAHGDEDREARNEHGVCRTVCPRPHAHRECQGLGEASDDDRAEQTSGLPPDKKRASKREREEEERDSEGESERPESNTERRAHKDARVLRSTEVRPHKKGDSTQSEQQCDAHARTEQVRRFRALKTRGVRAAKDAGEEAKRGGDQNLERSEPERKRPNVGVIDPKGVDTIELIKRSEVKHHVPRSRLRDASAVVSPAHAVAGATSMIEANLVERVNA